MRKTMLSSMMILLVIFLVGAVNAETVSYYHANGDSNEDCFGGTCLSMNQSGGPVYNTLGDANWGCGECGDVSIWAGEDMRQLKKKGCVDNMTEIIGVKLCLEVDNGEKWDIVFNTWSSSGSSEFGYNRSYVPNYNGDVTGTLTINEDMTISGNVNGEINGDIDGTMTSANTFSGTITNDDNDPIGTITATINTIGVDTFVGTITEADATETVRIFGFFPGSSDASPAGDFKGEIVTSNDALTVIDSINIRENTAIEGETLQMTAEILPTSTDILWEVWWNETTEDHGEATIDQETGMLTATDVGDVFVIASALDGSLITDVQEIIIIPTIVYVDDNYIESNSTHFMTIQDAIDAVAEGGIVYVAAGTYTGAIINKSVIIVGDSEGNSIVDVGVPFKLNSNAYTSAFRPDVGNIEIRNFKVTDNIDLGIYAIEIDNVTIDSLVIQDTVQGITNWGGSSWRITNNTIISTIASNGGGIGINVGIKAGQEAIGNLIQNNHINSTAVAESYSTPGILLCFDTRYGQYELIDGTEEISENKILDNIIVASGENNGGGIEVGAILTDMEDSEKINSLVNAKAIYNNYIKRNSIKGVKTGIYLYNLNDLSITENKITNSIEKGIYTKHAENITIHYNKIMDNRGNIVNNASSLMLNAIKNYWGTDNETEIKESISGNVSYSPYYTNEEMTELIFPTKDDGFGDTELKLDEELILSANVEIENKTETIEVTIPANITIRADSTWTGKISAPTIKETATIAPSKSGYTSTVSTVINVGFSGIKLIFNKAVKIVIPGEANKTVGYSYDGSTFTEITTECTGNNESWNTQNLPIGGECYLNDGSDLIIWTKHFTEFVTYEEEVIPATSSGGSSRSSSSGGSSYVAPINETIEESINVTEEKAENETVAAEEKAEGFLAPMTGAIIGTLGKTFSWIIAAFIGLVLIIGLSLIFHGGLLGASRFSRAKNFHKRAEKAHLEGEYEKATKLYNKSYLLREKGEAKAFRRAGHGSI